MFGDEGRLGAGRLPPARASRGGVPAATSAPGAGRRRPGSSGSAPRCRAVRERAGLIDLSSFGKIAVDGPGRPRPPPAGRRQRRRPTGRQPRLQPFLDERGGIVADVTVTRLADDRFRVVTGAGYVGRRPRLAAGAPRSTTTGRSTLRDESDDWPCIGPVGPAGPRRPRPRWPTTTVDDAALPLRRGAPDPGRPGAGPRLPDQLRGRARLGAATSRRDWAVAGLGPARRRRRRATASSRSATGRSTSLRLEKGYRYYGTDLTMLETPDEAGLGAFVRPDKGPFIGRDALLRPARSRARRPARRLRTVLVGGAGYQPIYGGEAVRIDGEVVGRLRSVAYGYTVGRTIGTVYLPAGRRRGHRARGRRLRRARRRRSSPPTSWSTRPATGCAADARPALRRSAYVGRPPSQRLEGRAVERRPRPAPSARRAQPQKS